MSMKNSNDTIGNRTRDLLACSAMPQTTAPPAACPDVTNSNDLYKLGRMYGQSVGTGFKILFQQLLGLALQLRHHIN
jgi:hypothetical protein